MTEVDVEYELLRSDERVTLTVRNGKEQLYTGHADPTSAEEVEALLEHTRADVPGLDDEMIEEIRRAIESEPTAADDNSGRLEFPQIGPHGFAVVGFADGRAIVQLLGPEDVTVFNDTYDPAKAGSLRILLRNAEKIGGVELTKEQTVEVARWLSSLNLRQHATQHQAEEKERAESPGTAAAALALERTDELHHDDEDDRRAHVDIAAEAGVRTVRVRSEAFREWIHDQYFSEFEDALGTESTNKAVSLIEAKAKLEGPHRRVHQRVARTEDGLWIDLGDDSHRVVEVRAGGWRLVDEYPVRFWRSPSTRPLPMPEHGGAVAPLRKVVNVGDDEEGERRFRLVVGFILGALAGRGPFPILVSNGEQGSGKSTLSRVVRSLVDPRKGGLRQPPRDVRDLAIAADNGWLIGYDNLSYLPGELSDGLCSLATGSGFGTRKLYTDDEERTFEQARPIIVNGIADLASARPDLLDRAIVLDLPRMEAKSRRTEAELSSHWKSTAPIVLGGLLDALASALERLPRMRHPEELPRMADFAMLVSAAEPALGWEQGTILHDLIDLAALQRELAVSHDAVASAVMRSLENPDALLRTGIDRTIEGDWWVGTPTDWLRALSGLASFAETNAPGWPKAPKALTDRLKRLAPALREVGVELEHGGWHRRQRALRLRWTR